MGQGRVYLTIFFLIAGFALVMHLFTNAIAPPAQDPTVTSFQMSRPRAPAEARKIKNPILVSREIVEEGDALYHGKGNCVLCHGEEGKGDGPSGALQSPRPRDLTDPNFQMLRADGEMFWSIKHGVSGTGMFSYAPRMISEEEAWKVIHYIRTLKAERRSS